MSKKNKKHEVDLFFVGAGFAERINLDEAELELLKSSLAGNSDSVRFFTCDGGNSYINLNVVKKIKIYES